MFPAEEFATTVARKLCQTGEGRSPDHSNAHLPNLETLSNLLDVLFWASIKTEEGRSIQARIFYVDPNNPDPFAPPRIRAYRWKIFPLSESIPLTVNNLVKLAKAADPWTSGLAAYQSDSGELKIWGMVDQVVHLSMALVQENTGYFTPPEIFYVVINGAADMTVVQEDFFVARLIQNEIVEDENDCLWEGRISKILSAWSAPLWRDAFKSAGRDAVASWQELWKYAAKQLWTQTLSRILINIQRQRHGGAILFCPATSDQELLIKYEMNYQRITEALKLSLYNGIILGYAREKLNSVRGSSRKTIPLDLYFDEAISEADGEDAEFSLTGAVKFVSSMAGVDGLILASPDFTVRGFGVEITTSHDLPEFVVARSADIKNFRRRPASSYGTRHRSMARYCAAHPGSIGFVVSQDGDIRAITKVGDDVVIFENVKVHSFWGDDFPKMARALRPKTGKNRSTPGKVS